MKLQKYTRARSTAAKEIGEGAIIGGGVLLGACVIGALIASLLKSPLSAIAATAIVVHLLSGGVCGVLSRGKRWVGTMALMGALCAISIITTKGHTPLSVLLGYGAFASAHLLTALIPKRQHGRKRRYK